MTDNEISISNEKNYLAASSHQKNLSCVLYYKNIMMINDASRVISEWRNNLEHHLQSPIMPLELSIMLLELSIMLLELSIMLLQDINSTGITDDDHHIMIICVNSIY